MLETKIKLNGDTLLFTRIANNIYNEDMKQTKSRTIKNPDLK